MSFVTKPARDHSSSNRNQYQPRNQQQSQQQSQHYQQSNRQQQRRSQNSSNTRNPNNIQQSDSSGQHSSRDPNNNADNLRTPTNIGGQRFIPGASTKELPPIETKVDPNQRKFTGRCRLFVGNLPHNTSEEKVRDIFERFGEVGEVFLGPKSAFAFIKMDTRQNAETARDNVDSTVYEGRTLRVRLAAHAAAIRVKNLSPQVTNELLAYAFRYFGEIERAVVVTDDKGKSICEGIVEYSKKGAAVVAIKRCQQENFMLTASPMPVLVEAYDQHDEEDGLPERAIAKHTPDFMREREVGPRFAEQGTFENEFASRWKELYEQERQRRAKVEEEIRETRQDLQNQIEYSRLEHDTVQLKNKLKQLEDDRMKLQQIKEHGGTANYYRQDDRRQSHMLYGEQREEEYNGLTDKDQSINTLKEFDETGQTGDSTEQSDAHQMTNSNNPGIILPTLVPNQTRSYAEATMVDMNQQYMQQPMANQQMIAMQMFPSFPPQQLGTGQLNMMNFSAPPPPVTSNYYPSSSRSSDSNNSYNNQKQKFKSYNNYNANSASSSTTRPRKRGRF